MLDEHRRILREVADTGRTPGYVYFLDDVRAQADRVNQAFGGRFRLSYAIKSNPNPALLEALGPIVGHLDASSIGEVDRAIFSGYVADRVSFCGPGKRDAELRRALELGVGLIVCESAGEIERLNRIAAGLGRQAPVALRINPRELPRRFGTAMGGRATQFGVDEEQAEEILALAAAQPGLRIQGLHIYAGSNTLSAEAAAENLANCLRIFEWLAPVAGPEFSTAIVGAGFGIPYADGDTPLDLEAAAAIVNPAVDAMRNRGALEGVDLMLELGRYLVGPAGYFLTSVIDVKTSRGVRFAICDGGFNAHLAACGMMGSVIRRNWPIEKIGGDLSAPPDVYNLVGPLCTSIDQLASQVRLPALVPGDTIAIASSGAYGLSASPTRFISHPEPHEFLVRHSGGRARVEDVTGAPAGAEA